MSTEPRLIWHQRNRPSRAAATMQNLQRRGDDDGAGRRQLIEIAKALQAELAVAVHDGVARIGWPKMRGLSGIPRCRTIFAPG